MYSIIIADDEPIERKALQLLLTSTFQNIEIVSLAQNGIELVDAIKKYQPDLALVDINMPGISGLDAISLLITQNTRTHFVITTAYSDFDYVKKALDMHVDGYILKPCSHSEILATLRKVFDMIEEERAEVISRQLINDVMNTIQPIYESEIMFSIMFGSPQADNFQAYCSLHNLNYNAGVIASFAPVSQESITPEMYDKIRLAFQQTFQTNTPFLLNITERGIVLLLFIPDSVYTKDMQRCTSWLHDSILLLMQRLAEHIPLRLTVGIGSICNDFLSLSDSYQESRLALKKASSQSICFYLKEDASPTSVRINDVNEYVARAIDFLHENYSLDISLESTADAIGINPFYLSHLFKQETGCSFIKYLTNVRLEEAVKLLSSDLSIAEISTQVGYLSPNYFCRIFKANTGMTITEYRKSRLQ